MKLKVLANGAADAQAAASTPMHRTVKTLCFICAIKPLWAAAAPPGPRRRGDLPSSISAQTRYFVNRTRKKPCTGSTDSADSIWLVRVCTPSSATVPLRTTCHCGFARLGV